jgi:hypothetical protein
MSGTIWLIVEDSNDRKVVEALLSARGIDVGIKLLNPSRDRGGISRLAADLENLIETARTRKQHEDCIAVLHDADENTQPNRMSYDRIEEICRRYGQDVVEVIARDEIEAWLLADSGLCSWLDIKPKNWDEQHRPSRELERLLKRKSQRMKYQGRYRDQVLEHLAGDGDKHSPSLRVALTHLDGAPCVDAAP